MREELEGEFRQLDAEVIGVAIAVLKLLRDTVQMTATPSISLDSLGHALGLDSEEAGTPSATRAHRVGSALGSRINGLQAFRDSLKS